MTRFARPSSMKLGGQLPGLAWICVFVLAILAVVAVTGEWVAPKSPSEQNLLAAGASPSAAHPLGTDRLGRDILSRVVVGTRSALIGPLVVALCTTVIAVALGLVAGYKGGRIEEAIMRIADVVFALPSLLVVVVAIGLFGGGYWVAVALLVLLACPAGIRIVRSAVLTQRHLPYVEAAITLGVPTRKVMIVHILPNIAANVVASALLELVGALVALSALSFLGLGSPPGTPDWGRMLSENRELLPVNPLAAVVPAILLILTAASATVLGDSLFHRLREGRASRVDSAH